MAQYPGTPAWPPLPQSMGGPGQEALPLLGNVEAGLLSDAMMGQSPPLESGEPMPGQEGPGSLVTIPQETFGPLGHGVAYGPAQHELTLTAQRMQGADAATQQQVELHRKMAANAPGGQLGQPSPQLQIQPRPPQLGDFGLGELRQQLGRLGANRQAAAADYQQQMLAAAEGKKRAVADLANAETDKNKALADLQKSNYNLQQGEVIRAQTEEAEYKNGRAKLMKAMDDEGLIARYWNGDMTADEIRAHQSKLNDPTAPAEERAAAKMKLAEAEEVNQGRILGDAGTMIGAILLSALGGAAAALTGGPNQVLSVIKDAIARDIASQQERREMKAKGVKMAATDLDRYDQIYGNTQQAALALMNRRLLASKSLAESIMSQYEGQAAQGRGQQIVSAINEDVAKNNLAMVQHSDDASLRNIAMGTQIAGQQSDIQKTNIALAGGAGGPGPGAKGAPPGKPVEGAIAEKIAVTDEGLSTIDRLEQAFREKASGVTGVAKSVFTGNKEWAQEKNAQAIALAKALKGGSEFSEKDIAGIARLLPDALDTQEKAREKLDVLRGIFRGRRQSLLDVSKAAGRETAAFAQPQTFLPTE